jgi:hypothetical protein
MNVSADVATHMERLERLKAKHGNGNGAGVTLGIAAQLAAWATPAHRDYRFPNLRTYEERGGGAKGEQLANQVAHTMAWPRATPSAGDAKASGTRNTPQSKAHAGYSLTDQIRGDLGTGRSCTSAATESTARYLLNPRFSLWLQGYPTEWARCAERVTRSWLRSPRSSSPHSST